jgi:autotransporter-associated beta strand protein
LQYDGMGNIFTYVEGKGLFRYRDPSYDELDFVNLTVGGNSAVTVTSGPGVSVLGSLSFRNDLSGNFGTLTIVDPVTVRTGNLYVQRDEWGRDSTGVIEGGTLLTDGDMHKINDGTLILNNVNTYTGKTIIDDGKLIVNGSIAGDAVVTDNATLGGHGLIGGSVTINSGGTISPGNSPGTLTTGAETWAGGGAYVWELNTASDAGGAKGVTYDWLNIGGQLSIDSTSGNKFTIYVTSLTAGNGAGFAAGFVPGQSYTFTIATATTPIAGFSADKFLIDTSAFFNDTANTGGFAIVQSLDGLSLNLTYTAVPEPGAWGAILGLGLLALAATRKLRRSC